MINKAIIYTSYHHKNTINLINSAVDEKEYDFYNLLKGKDYEIDFSKYETLIFASGIYFSKMQKRMLAFLENNKEALVNKKIVAIITAGIGAKRYARKVKKYFKKLNNLDIIVFSCRGFDTFGILKVFGGINKGRPNEKDINNLKEFLKENNL